MAFRPHVACKRLSCGPRALIWLPPSHCSSCKSSQGLHTLSPSLLWLPLPELTPGGRAVPAEGESRLHWQVTRRVWQWGIGWGTCKGTHYSGRGEEWEIAPAWCTSCGERGENTDCSSGGEHLHSLVAHGSSGAGHTACQSH